MSQVIFSISCLLAAWKWGDWRNWVNYYPTMLFTATGSFLYMVITSNYPLWVMEPAGLPNHTITDLLFACISLPSLVLVYLSLYPAKKPALTRMAYVAGWILLAILLEYLGLRIGAMSYHNGWTIWWSFLFDIVMFSLFLLHHKKPLWAWLFSLWFIVFILTVFDISLDKMK